MLESVFVILANVVVPLQSIGNDLILMANLLPIECPLDAHTGP